MTYNIPLRSLLFTPGDSRRKIEKVAQLAADGVILDLEDAVALAVKPAARQTVADALQTVDFGGCRRFVRLNPAETGLLADDLQATVAARPDGYALPKVENAGQVQAVDRALAEAEQAHGWAAGTMRLLAMIETARGLLNLPEIAQSSDRLAALLLGAEDFAASVNAERTAAGWEILYARSQLVTAAKACGLQAIDTVYTALDDLNGLEAECRFARQLGFDGKLAVHPRQVEPINRCFTPSPEAVAQARRVVAAFAEHRQAGRGVFELDGKMLDMPMLRAAEQILAKARGRGDG